MENICKNCGFWSKVGGKTIGICIGHSADKTVTLTNTKKNQVFTKHMVLRSNFYDSCDKFKEKEQ